MDSARRSRRYLHCIFFAVLTAGCTHGSPAPEPVTIDLQALPEDLELRECDGWIGVVSVQITVGGSFDQYVITTEGSTDLFLNPEWNQGNVAGSFDLDLSVERGVATLPASFDIVVTVTPPVDAEDQAETVRRKTIHVVDGSCGPAGDPADLIVFSNTPPDAGADSEIYVIDAEGGNLTQLTSNGVQDWDPSWSHDRMQIAYISNPSGVHFDLMVMDANGDNQFPLGQVPGQSFDDPAWSPTGSLIAVSLGPTGFADQDIWIVDAFTGERRQLTTGGHGDLSPTWSPDGLRVAFLRNGAILWKEATADAAVVPQGITTSMFDFPLALDWGPLDLIFESYLVLAGSKHRIHRTDESGTELPPVTTGGTHGKDRVPSWSPAADRVVFVRQETLEDSLRAGRLWTVLVDGTGAAELPGQPDGGNNDPDWGFPLPEAP